MVADKLAESRETRSKITKAKYVNATTKEPYTAELKRKHIDELIAIENEMARQAIIQIRKANFDTIESDIFGKTYDPEKYSTKEKKGVDFEMRKLFD
jgi:hypothetical protein